MFDGETLSRQGHSAGCVTLLDGTVVVSVFGGCTTTLWPSVVSNPCFYQWGKSMLIVIQEDRSVCICCVQIPVVQVCSIVVWHEQELFYV